MQAITTPSFHETRQFAKYRDPPSTPFDDSNDRHLFARYFVNKKKSEWANIKTVASCAPASSLLGDL